MQTAAPQHRQYSNQQLSMQLHKPKPSRVWNAPTQSVVALSLLLLPPLATTTTVEVAPSLLIATITNPHFSLCLQILPLSHPSAYLHLLHLVQIRWEKKIRHQ